MYRMHKARENGGIFSLRRIMCLLGWHSWVYLPYRESDWWLDVEDGRMKVYRIIYRRCSVCLRVGQIHTKTPVYPNKN